MSTLIERDDLAKLPVPELAQAYVESIQAMEATEHIGRKNRFARQASNIYQELKARGEARPVFQLLANHSDQEVARWARSNLDWLDRPPAAPEPRQPVSKGRFWPQIVWQCDHPPPPALTRDDIAERLRRSVPEACDRLMDLALPAIGLWPQRRAEVAATMSRFGGAPLAPPGWQWPVAQEEPRLFVGQINCAEFDGVPGAELLPPAGILAFFGDHDAVVGSFPFDSDCVFYWPDVDRLVPAKAAIDPLEVFPSCALVPRPLLDLPHPFSHAVSKLSLSKEQDMSYRDVWWAIRDHGIPRDCVGYAGFSKLLGWPDLVQSDLGQFGSDGDARLLLQVDRYCNGEVSHDWGPGGSLYYALSEQNLRARRYERCELEGQFT